MMGPTVLAADVLAWMFCASVLLTYMATPFVAMDWIGGYE